MCDNLTLNFFFFCQLIYSLFVVSIKSPIAIYISPLAFEGRVLFSAKKSKLLVISWLLKLFSSKVASIFRNISLLWIEYLWQCSMKCSVSSKVLHTQHSFSVLSFLFIGSCPFSLLRPILIWWRLICVFLFFKHLVEEPTLTICWMFFRCDPVVEYRHFFCQCSIARL